MSPHYFYFCVSSTSFFLLASLSHIPSDIKCVRILYICLFVNNNNIGQKKSNRERKHKSTTAIVYTFSSQAFQRETWQQSDQMLGGWRLARRKKGECSHSDTMTHWPKTKRGTKKREQNKSKHILNVFCFPNP